MRLVWFAFLFPLLVNGQEMRPTPSTPDKSFNQYINDFSEVEGKNESTPDISGFVTKLERRETQKNSLKFCRLLFHKTRQEFFRRYTQDATFRETLSKGKYNCLTGTALYALLLKNFGIPYSIIETNYHIFLLVSTDEGNVLFEATDPLHGFVSNPQEIEKRIQLYRQNIIQRTAGDEKTYYAYNVNLYRQVTLDEMSGLLHYNLSTKAYNQQNFSLAIHHLDKALDLHNSPRFDEFSSILLLSVMESKLEDNVKESYLKRIQSIRKRQVPVMASRGHSH